MRVTRLLREVVSYKFFVISPLAWFAAYFRFSAQDSLRGLLSFVWRSKMSKNDISKTTDGRNSVPVNFWKLQCLPSMLLSDMTWLMTSTDASTFGLLVLIGSEVFLLLHGLISRKWALLQTD